LDDFSKPGIKAFLAILAYPRTPHLILLDMFLTSYYLSQN
jgi:hypothetical protein